MNAFLGGTFFLSFITLEPVRSLTFLTLHKSICLRTYSISMERINHTSKVVIYSSLECNCCCTGTHSNTIYSRLYFTYWRMWTRNREFWNPLRQHTWLCLAIILGWSLWGILQYFLKNCWQTDDYSSFWSEYFSLMFQRQIGSHFFWEEIQYLILVYCMPVGFVDALNFQHWNKVVLF